MVVLIRDADPRILLQIDLVHNFIPIFSGSASEQENDGSRDILEIVFFGYELLVDNQPEEVQT
tara:strand:- start:253 stop:441 length:189 start_codon:yes stop_codon:yes gene_type:complete